MKHYESNLSIKSWAEEDRPREKLLLKGKQALSEAELLAILIGSGTRNESAVELCKKILNLSDNNLDELGKMSVNDLMGFKGIGEAKAISLVAAMELGRRRQGSEIKKRRLIKDSNDVYQLLVPLLSDLPHEEFWVLFLNRSNKVTGKKQVSIGGVTGTVADSRIIYKMAVERLASGIIVGHNHPSGSLKPSQRDRHLTKKLADAGRLLDIQLLDHLIIGDGGYFSFADEGLL